MTSSPIYEFPYSGYKTSSLPFLNYTPNVFSSNINSSLDDLIYNQPSMFTMHNQPQFTSILNNNTNVYRVPDNISLDTVLRQLGVDVSLLQQSSSSINNYYTSTPRSEEFILPRSSNPYRRLICHEVSDSESDDDDDDRHPSHHHQHHYRDHYDSRFNQYDQPPAHCHSLLRNVWEKLSRASPDLSQADSRPNVNKEWRTTQNRPASIWSGYQNTTGDAWNRAANTSNQQPSRMPSSFNRMNSGSGSVIQPPPGPQRNQEAVQDFFAARNVLSGINQPNPAWNSAYNTAQRGPSSTLNPYSNQMSSSLPAMTSGWNQMSGPSLPPPQQPFRSPGPPVNSTWNQTQQGSFQPRNPPYSSPPMGAPQQGSYSPAAPGSFASLLSQSRM